MQCLKIRGVLKHVFPGTSGGFGVVLPDTNGSHEKGKGDLAELETAGSVGGWRSVWELGKVESQHGNISRATEQRCCSLGIVQFTDEY